MEKQYECWATVTSSRQILGMGGVISSGGGYQSITGGYGSGLWEKCLKKVKFGLVNYWENELKNEKKRFFSDR